MPRFIKKDMNIKHILLVFSLITFTLGLQSCLREEETPAQIITIASPVNAITAQNEHLAIVDTFLNQGFEERGLIVIPLKDGFIQNLALNLPVNDSVQATFWRNDQPNINILGQDDVLYTAGTWNWYEIPFIEVKAEDTIMVTIKTSNWFSMTDTTLQDTPLLPDTINNVVLFSSVRKSANDNDRVFTDRDPNFLNGLVDLTFRFEE